jgi:hypothetical protein
LSAEKCQVLKGRDVTLFPDAGKYAEWSERAKSLSTTCTITTSSLIEEKATETERREGFDLADYLVRYLPSDFARVTPSKNASAIEPNQSPTVSEFLQCCISPPMDDLPDFTILKPKPIQIIVTSPVKDEASPKSFLWDEEIAELEAFYSSTQIPNGRIPISLGVTIIDANKFITSHLETVKNYNGKTAFLPYLHRLQAFKHLLS